MAKDLAKYVGKSVTLVGWPLASKEVTTKKGEPVEFWAFEDEVDVFHCVLFPKAYEKFCRLPTSVQPLVISGVVQEEYEAVTVNVVNVSALLFGNSKKET
jgi:DNA polymerase III alpha subunit